MTAPTPHALTQTNTYGTHKMPILKHRSFTEIPSLSSSTVPLPLSRSLPPHTKRRAHTVTALRERPRSRTSSWEFAGGGLSVDEPISSGTPACSEQDFTPHIPQPGKRKYISFNTFVEQGIPIEIPKQKRPSTRFADEVFGDDNGSVSSSSLGL